MFFSYKYYIDALIKIQSYIDIISSFSQNWNSIFSFFTQKTQLRQVTLSLWEASQIFDVFRQQLETKTDVS